MTYLMRSLPLHIMSVLVMSVVCFPSTLSAHDSPITRELIVQHSTDAVLIMLAYEMPAGEHVERLMVRYDLDHDGVISTLEAPQMANVLLPAALDGLSFEVPGERPAAQEPEVKIRRTDEGKLAMAVLMTYTLPAIEDDASRTLRVTLASDPHAIHTPLIAQTVEQLVIVAVDERPLATPQAKISQVISPKHPCAITVQKRP